MNSDILTICMLLITIIFSTISIILILEFVKKNQRTRNNNDKVVNINDERKYYEEQLYKIQYELMQNEKRWKEVNHLIINSQNLSPDIMYEKKAISTTFFENLGIDLNNIKPERKTVFVLTPFLDIENETFARIQKVCGEVDLKCSRGDEIYRDKDILSHIVSSILKANVVIANINGRNPNVFYELGICHAIGKPVILISKHRNNLPFDIKSKNIIFYKDFEQLQKLLKEELLKIFINN